MEFGYEKNSKSFFLFIFVNLIVNSFSSELEKFYKKYQLPLDKLRILNKNKNYLAHEVEDVFKWEDYLPGFYIKRESSLDRIINSERIRNCIKRYGLTHFDIPKKYLYKYQKQLYIIAEEVEGIPLGVLSVEEIRQLIILILISGYADLNTSNIMRRESDNKLVIIDTDKEAFSLDRDYALSTFFILFRNAGYIDQEGELFFLEYQQSNDPLIFFDEKKNILNISEFDEEIGINLNQVKIEYNQ